MGLEGGREGFLERSSFLSFFGEKVFCGVFDGIFGGFLSFFFLEKKVY